MGKIRSGANPSDADPLQKIYDVDAIPDDRLPRRFEAESLCPLCETTDADRLYRIPDADKQIVCCPTCGIGRIDPTPTMREISSYYPRDYYGSSGKKFRSLIERLLMVVSRRQVRFIRQRVPEGGRILDVGCGRGMLGKSLVESGYRVSGTDFSVDATIGIDPRIELRISPSLSEAGFEKNSFDAVVIWHVLEHLSDPAQTLEEIQALLRCGGRLFVAVPNFSSVQARCFGPDWFHLDPPRHLYQFTSDGLAAMLDRAGFEILSSYHFSLRQNPFGWIQSALNALPGARRNSLYCAMHNLSNRGVSAARNRVERVFNLVAAPLAIALTAVMAAFRRGATVSFDAQKRGPL